MLFFWLIGDRFLIISVFFGIAFGNSFWSQLISGFLNKICSVTGYWVTYFFLTNSRTSGGYVRDIFCALFLCAAGTVHASPAYTNEWTGLTRSMVTGVIATSEGNVDVTLSLTNYNDTRSKAAVIQNSSLFSTFYGGATAADVYAAALPGKNDFVRVESWSEQAVYTLSFSREVENPIFHVYNLDYRYYNFLGDVSATVLSGFNMVAYDNVVSDNDMKNHDEGYFTDKSRGSPTSSAYGSFQLNGTFTTIQWTRPGSGADGNSLGLSVGIPSSSPPVTPVPEPNGLALVGLALGLMGAVYQRRSTRNAMA
ncbi:hypothetical protein [Azohydromonas lata]|uniref:hypothetical protein n=1 Tax=Azohydromonas lata TaxID=45677 RepID=UPI0012F4D4E6|nr:hypothetical protein [Azohydromonas lata]